MRRVVNLRERLEVEVGIDLRGRNARVAEHLLHGTQVLRRLQHVRGERVPQHVRMYPLWQAARPAPRGEARGDDRGRYAPPARADEKRLLVGTRELVADLEPCAQGVARLRADRHRPRLRALAGDGYLTLSEIHAPIRCVETNELCAAQARRVKELEHRAIPRDGE